jgi:pyridoxamine 5'-phosphate oxidase
VTLADLRRHYSLKALKQGDLEPHPIDQFKTWFAEAIEARILEPNAMILATADAHGKPSARTVLLKGIDERGFIFYTNYGSRKAAELEENPQAALVFNWLELERQVRVEGTAGKVSREESAAYFKSRPRGSQLAAWLSRQSQEIASHAILEEELKALHARYPGEVPLPPFWGGYRVAPQTIEFWQGRPNRLHDRLLYTWQEAAWEIRRLAP